MWDLPGPGLELVSPSLAGRFLTTAPPGSPIIIALLNMNYLMAVVIMKTPVDLNWKLQDTILNKKQTADDTNCIVSVKFNQQLIPVEYSRFLLPTVVILYKVALNTELANTDPLLPGEIQA